MISWITSNLVTILISIAIILLVAGIIIKLRKDKKNGKSSCSCNCAQCPMGGSCHNNTK
ncbi:MAG: FeoB-associated Cys-rich membrane protein [Clostridiales bacterium]|nr:FeoB-associated Cys-rich membrane protein [Clostridiales bacterium]